MIAPIRSFASQKGASRQSNSKEFDHIAYKYLCKLTGSLIFPAYESIEINVPVDGFITM